MFYNLLLLICSVKNKVAKLVKKWIFKGSIFFAQTPSPKNINNQIND